MCDLLKMEKKIRNQSQRSRDHIKEKVALKYCVHFHFQSNQDGY
jgi:hypothetical protein